jgi:hypothetical protein
MYSQPDNINEQTGFERIDVNTYIQDEFDEPLRSYRDSISDKLKIHVIRPGTEQRVEKPLRIKTKNLSRNMSASLKVSLVLLLF